MKKLFAILLAAMLTLSLVACSNEEETKEPAETTPPAVETPVEEEEEETPPAEESETEEESEAETEAEEAVDYSTAITDWMYQPESSEEATLALMAIDACEYGTAGASLKQTNAAVQMLKLTAMETTEDALGAYLDSMNATQKDYFSFQWQMTMKAAEELLTMEDATALLEESGNGDVDLTAYNAEALSALNDSVSAALTEAGVEDVWKENLELEPFMNWEENSESETATA